MHAVRIRLHVAEDGTVTGHVPDGVPVGEHDAEVILPAPERKALAPAEMRETVRVLQDELARLPVLDSRTPTRAWVCQSADFCGHWRCGPSFRPW